MAGRGGLLYLEVLTGPDEVRHRCGNPVNVDDVLALGLPAVRLFASH